MTSDQTQDLHERLFALEVLTMQMGALLTAKSANPSEIAEYWQAGMDLIVKNRDDISPEDADGVLEHYKQLTSSIEAIALEFKKIASEA